MRGPGRLYEIDATPCQKPFVRLSQLSASEWNSLRFVLSSQRLTLFLLQSWRCPVGRARKHIDQTTAVLSALISAVTASMFEVCEDMCWCSRLRTHPDVVEIVCCDGANEPCPRFDFRNIGSVPAHLRAGSTPACVRYRKPNERHEKNDLCSMCAW